LTSNQLTFLLNAGLSAARSQVARIIRNGKEQYPDRGHEIWNLAAREPAWREWMFAHSRCDTACPAPTGSLTLKLSRSNDGLLQLIWNDIRDPDVKADQIWYYQIFDGENLIGTTEFDQTAFEIPPDNAGGTFAVRAVNYCFGVSERSNTVADSD